MGSRRKARILALQALFSREFNSTPLETLLKFPWLEEERVASFDQETLDFGRLLVTGTLENIDEIDDAIRQRLEHWDFSRLSKVDLSILRMSIYSMWYQPDIPISVTIDEAIDIAKKYGQDESYRFVNGILDGVRKGVKRSE
jgi:N utilization substance protein B